MRRTRLAASILATLVALGAAATHAQDAGKRPDEGHRRQDHRLQRLSRQSAIARTFGLNTTIPAAARPAVGGAEYMAAHVAKLKAAEPEQRRRRRRRLHRRIAADLGAVLRRAGGRDAEPHRPRVQRRRQPRIRQRLRRAAAPAERRLQDRERHRRSEQLPRRGGRHAGAVRGREVPVAVGERHPHVDRPHAASGLRHQGVRPRGAEIAARSRSSA